MEDCEHRSLTNPPGGVLVWFIIFMEMITFIAGIFFFFSYRQDNVELFLEMQKKLSINFAVMNTIALVTSGYFVALALNYLKNSEREKSRKFLLLGIIFGSCFVVIKLFEYYEKLSQGLDTSYNYFFTFYWFLTFFHFMHVVFVTLILSFIYFKIKKEEKGEIVMFEVGAALWHMCDLIWIILFPTLFLVR